MRRRSKSEGGNSRCKSEGTARTPEKQGEMEEARKAREEEGENCGNGPIIYGMKKIVPSVVDPDREQAGSEGV